MGALSPAPPPLTDEGGGKKCVRVCKREGGKERENEAQWRERVIAYKETLKKYSAVLLYSLCHAVSEGTT